MLVLGIETSTQQTTVALGTEQETVAALRLGGPQASHDLLMAGLVQLLGWSGLELAGIGGIAVSLGPGLFTGMRVGIATAKTLAQSLTVPIVGLASLDVLAFQARYARRLICAVIDAKRGEVFHAFYRPVPGGVARETDFQVDRPDGLAAELAARGEDVLLVGNGGLVYRRELEREAGRVEFASAALAYPLAEALVELAVPRFEREEYDRLEELEPHYVRKSDAEIAWDQRRGTL